MKEELALFLERIPGLLSFDEFLPKQAGEVFELRQHQKEALDSLDQIRADHKTIALLTHAQGAGKTVVAIAEMSDGSFWSDSISVIITLGACLENLI